MNNDLTSLTEAVVGFSHRRGWGSFHSPRNLLLALVGEVGELAAELQWVPETEAHELSEEHLTRVRHELADVQIYVLQFAHALGIDVASAVHEKMAINLERWPEPTP